ncbi:hypothetical protein ACHAW5_009375 [Stephanodiscus triporus]|uniref:2-(3-amino-3-carboxypropyl)histidine synthase subunit 2 n=1 Tax=Stephanodiscus triporus TaxID=2934178 RepID=A0ABD3NUR0_9STRA
MQDATTPSNHDNQRTSNPSARGAVPVRVYYEIDRVAKDVVEKLDWSETTSRGRLLRQIRPLCRRNDSDNGEAPHDAMDDGKVANNANERRVVGATNTNSNDEEDDGFLCRIALQFPDDLLSDAPTVSWLLEDAIAIAYNEKLMESSLVMEATSSAVRRFNQLALHDSHDSQLLIEEHLAHRNPLVFILGDASPSCCPDEVSANHLNANVIVHYGYACLAPTESVPVVYAFGVSRGVPDGGDAYDESGDVTIWKECVQLVSNECHGKVEAGEILLAKSMSMENSNSHEKKHRKLLLLYDVRYHHAMNSLKLEFEKAEEQFQVVLGSIPKQQLTDRRFEPRKREGCGSDGNCGGGDCASNACTATVSNDVPHTLKGHCGSRSDCEQSSQSCCGKDASSCCTDPITANCGIPNTNANDTETIDHQHDLDKQYIPRTIGGIEIPDDLDLRQYTLLYIGDDMDIDSHEGNECTRLLLILLRCNAPDGPKFIFSYSPITRRLNADVLNSPMSLTNVTTPSTVLSRLLRRRYFLLNKAKLATTIAILIGTSSQSYSFRRLLSLTRHRIQSTGRTAYTFSVGKLSTAGHKLSNFAEIDCYVLIACGESVANFWKMEREAMCVPVLTPLELDVALGFREWDGRYSCDFGDLIRWNEADGIVAKDEFHGDDDDSASYGNHKDMLKLNKAEKCDDDERNNFNADEPFFSMISGKYEQSKAVDTSNQNAIMSCSSIHHLKALPGQGRLIEYRSEAAEFLKKREYRGLEAKVGETEVKAAVLGMVGIASDYGENP